MRTTVAALLIAMFCVMTVAAQESVTKEAKDEILRAIKLPVAAEEVRRMGVPAEDVEEVLRAARGRRVPAGDTQILFEEESRAVKEKGTIDNFGAFVKSKLDEGLRGRELADAIHAEHAARGHGKGRAGGKGKPGVKAIGVEEDLDKQQPSKTRGKRGAKKPAEDPEK